MRSNSRKGTGSGPETPTESGPSHEKRGLGLEKRRDRRFPLELEVRWDFFSIQDGLKQGTVLDLSPQGCQLQTDHPIEVRRWLRLMLPLPGSVVHACCVARTVWAAEDSDGLHRYGVEFVRAVPLPWIQTIREQALAANADKNALVDARQMLTELATGDSGTGAGSPLYASLLNGNFLR